MRTARLVVWAAWLLSACGGSEFEAGASGAAGSAQAVGAGGSSAGSSAAGSSTAGASSGASGSSTAGASSGAGGSGSGAGGTSGASGSTSGAAGSTSGAAGSTSGAAGAGGGSPCADSPVDATGVFVSPAGNDANDGSPGAPVKSLATAVSMLGATRRALYLASDGVYPEQLSLPAGIDGLDVHGGYAPKSGKWLRTCGERAHVQATTAVGALVGGASKGSLVMRELRITSKSLDVSGDPSARSSIALKITGPLTVNLEGLVLTAGKGEDGRSGKAGMTPLPPATCTPTCASGATGKNAEPGAPGAAGTFSIDGYAPKGGKDGLPGGNGADGTQGSPAKVVTGCTTSCNGCPPTGCQADKTAQVGVAASTCGCGGLGGAPGGSGDGGGASIAIFAAGGANVTVLASTLVSGAGGKGGTGGDGGDGLSGTPGSPGAVTPYQLPLAPDGSTVCHRGDCALYGGPGSCGCYYQDTKPDAPTVPEKVFPNPPGGPGGGGGKGAKGGGGAGGPSIVIARDGLTTVATGGDVVFQLGNPGQGSNGAPPGAAQMVLAF